MKKITIYRSLVISCCCILAVLSAKAQFGFTNSNSLITTATHSGCAVTVVDVNNDGLDDILIMDQATTLVLELQNQDGTFTRTSLGTITTGGARVWGMAAADVDHNGWKDVITGTDGTLYLVKLSAVGSVVSATTTTMAQSYFVQNVTFGDFNNDGWIDVEVCDDVDYARVYMNDGAGNLPLLAHSVTSMTIGTGTQTFTVQTAGLATFNTGDTVKVGFNALNYMTGTVTSFTAGTGAMVVDVVSVVGSGTYATWSVHPNVVMNININGTANIGGDPDDSGNYGSVWTDFDNDGDLDLYIAHCRQSANSNTDVRRRDRLFENDGHNNFTEDAQSHNIEVTDFIQTWTTSFGDIDDDGDLDILMTNHGQNGQLLQNDGAGNFTDITAGSGYVTTVDPIESVLEDFDNDGFLDILISGGGSAANSPWIVYHNNGNSTFTAVTAPFPAANNGMLSFATGDLNHDGKVDVYASYGNVYNTPTTTADVLYLNNTNNQNHFITFNLTGTVSNSNAIGARVTIYGPWGGGKQIREVRAGETYGTSNSMQLHFGIGASTSIDSARIDWPSHTPSVHFGSLAADQYVTAIEGQCTLTGNIVPGPYIICTGQTLTLTAASGFSSYLWSNGATTQSVTLDTTGTINVLVSNAAGCTNVSPTVTIALNPNQTPVLTTTGTIAPCAGTLTISSSPAISYSWTGPSGFTATTQAIQPTVAGTYVVTVAGTCANFSDSTTVAAILSTPPSPTGTGATGTGPISLTLNATATGTGTLTWYDSLTGGASVGTGTSYITPLLTNTTTYYVDEETSYPGATGNVGQPYHTGASLFNNTFSGAMDFNVLAPCTLVSFKVYTDSASHFGVRQLQILNNLGTVIDSMNINVTADTTVITVNIPLAVGSAYRITTNATIDNTNFGAGSPFLERSSSGVVYPYTISNLVSIYEGWNGTGIVTGGYYYFYDWVVQAAPIICASPRVPVVATITNSLGVSQLSSNNGVQVYPNPASDEVNVTFENTLSTTALVELTDITGRLVNSWSFEKPTQGQNVKLNVSNITAGTYLLNIATDSKKVVQKLVLTK